MTELAEQLLDRDQASSWCADHDPTGRYVCSRIQNHELDWHAGRNGAGGIHQWPAATPTAVAPNGPSDCPVGTVLVDPKTGNWAVRFTRGDDTGKGQHVWLSPPGVVHAAQARFLHHVEVRGWEIAEARRWGRVAEDEPPVNGDLRARCISVLGEMVSEFISPNEFGGYDIGYSELVDIVLAEVQPVLDRQAVEIADHSRAAEIDESTKAELAKANTSLLAMLERMETLHVTWLGPGGEEFHPDWCRECRVDKARAELADLESQRDAWWNQRAAELADVRASREAWAIEADRLDVIATAARYYVQPDTCDGSGCDHDDDVCVHMDERHATADDAIAAARVPWLKAERERLLEIAARYGELSLAVADALHVSASTSNDDLIAMLDQPLKAGSDTTGNGEDRG